MVSCGVIKINRFLRIARPIFISAAIVLLCVSTSFSDEIYRFDTGGHTALIRYVAFTRDGKRLVSAGDDKTIRIWDIDTGLNIIVIRGRAGFGSSGKIHAAALSPDEMLLAVGGWMGPDRGYRLDELGRIRLHRFPSGKVIGLLDGHRDVVLSLSFSPDSTRLASGGMDGRIKIHRMTATGGEPDPNSKPVSLKGPRSHVYALGYSSDGRLLAAGDDSGYLCIWNSEGRLLHGFQAHDGRLRALAWFPDENRLITGASDCRIKIWDAESGRLIKTLAVLEKIPRRLSISPDGKTLLASTASFEGPWRSVFLSTASGKETASFAGYRHSVLANGFSPDGGLAAIGGGRNHRIHIVDTGTGRLVKTLSGAGFAITGVGISRDGNRIGWTGNVSPAHLERELNIRKTGNRAAGEINRVSAGQFTSQVHELGGLQARAFPGGDYGYPDAILRVAKDGRVLSEIKRDAFTGYRHRCFSFTPDGGTIISGGDLGVITAYDTKTGEAAGRLEGHEGAVLDLAVSGDGTRLVSGSDDQTIRVWDLSRLGAESRLRPILTVFADKNGEWSGWTGPGDTIDPAAVRGTAAGKRYIGVQINHGFDRNADFSYMFRPNDSSP